MRYAERHSRYRQLVSVSVAVVCLTSCLLPLAKAQSEDEASIRALIEKFFAAYQKEDLDSLLALWSEKAPGLAMLKQGLQNNFSNNERIELKRLVVVKTVAQGSRATVRIQMEMSAIESTTSKPCSGFGAMDRTFKLVKEGEKWKVWQYRPSEAELAEAMVAAKTEEERKKLLQSGEELVTVELARALITQGVQFQNQADAAPALSSYQLALEIAARVGLKRETAIALRSIGNIYYSQNSNLQALEYYRKSLPPAEESGDRDVISASLSNVAMILNWQGNNTQAVQYYERALQLSQESGNEPRLARTMNNLALVYVEQGEYEKGLELAQKTLKLAAQIKSIYGKDYGEAFRALTSIANVYSAQSNYARALQFYQKCLKIAEDSDDSDALTIAHNNIGSIHLSQGNSEQALESFMKGLQAAQTSGDKEWIATSLVSIGLAHKSRRDYTLALESFRMGLKIFKEIDSKDDSRVLAGIGDIHYAQGNYVGALQYYNETLRLSQEAGRKSGIARMLIQMGDVYRQQELYSKAVEMTERAAVIARAIGDPQVLSDARTVAGKAYHSLNQPERARRAFADAISAVETMRGQVAGAEQEQQRFFENEVSPYYAMTELLLEQHEDAAALDFAERAKGRVLLDVLRSGKTNVTKAMTTAEQAEERKYNAEIISLNKQIIGENSRQQPDTMRLAALNASLQKARLEYEEFRTNLYVAHPELKVQRGEIRPLTLEQVGALLDAKTAMLEFVLGEERSYLFVVTKAERAGNSGIPSVELKVYPIQIKRKDLDNQAQSFRKILAERNLDYQKTALGLYQLLLKPAERQLQGKTTLCIVPDGELWELPFQALQPRENRFLQEDFAVFYAPSLSVLGEMVSKSDDSRWSLASWKKEKVGVVGEKTADTSMPPGASRSVLLAFGNPVLNGETVNMAKSIHRDEKLGPLPEAEKEVKALAEIYGPARSKVLIGAEASESEAKREAGRYRVLHFATHGILDDNNPLYSRVVLSAAGGEATEDGLLEAWEIMKMDLRADLVVLSACQTARGRVGAGEGIIGMSWALFVAGSPAILASQWKVDSASTTQLMIKFHRRLSFTDPHNARIGKSQALRDAVKELISDQRTRHPFYWAGFVIVGNGF